jgi:hypothetical protein
MKVHDIISEATPPGLGTAIKAGVNAFKAARTSAPAVAKATAKTAPKAASTAAKGATTATKAVTQSVDDLSWWEKMAIKNADKIKGKEVALAKGALKSEVLKSSADDIVKFLTAAQMIKEASVYWLKSNELDAQLASGAINQQKYDEEITKLRGLAITSILAPKIGAWGAGKLATFTGLKLIPWVVKVSGSPNAAEAMKYLTSKAVQAGIIAWMGAGDGKKWLEDTFGIMITGVGSLPGMAGTVVDALKAVQQTATGTGGAADLQKQRDAGDPKAQQDFDPNDPSSIMGKAIGGAFADPFKGTGRSASIL